MSDRYVSCSRCGGDFMVVSSGPSLLSFSSVGPRLDEWLCMSCWDVDPTEDDDDDEDNEDEP